MTSRERLLAAIRHQEPDRVPVSPRIGAFLNEYYGHAGWMYELKAAQEFGFDPLVFLGSPYPNCVRQWHASYDDLEDVRVQLSTERHPTYTLIRRRIDTPAGPLSDCVRQYKGGIGYGSSPNPHWEERLVKEETDLERLAYLLPTPTKAAFEPVAEMADVVGDRGLIQVTIESAIDHRAGWAYELVDMMVAAYEKPAFLRALLNLFHRYCLAETRCALEAGVPIIFTPWYFASMSAGWSPKLYQEWFLPLIKEQADLIHDLGGLLHFYDDGKCMAILPWLREVGVDIISTLAPPPVGDVDLKAAKDLVGDRICLNGNIDLIYVIKMGRPEQIREAVRQAIVDAAPGGGLILGTSDSIRDTEPENVRAYFQAARDYGVYGRLGRK